MVSVSLRDDEARTAWAIAAALHDRWSFELRDDGAVLAVAEPGARAVPLSAALVAAGASEEGVTSARHAAPADVVRAAHLLLEGWARLGDAGVAVRGGPLG